MRITILFMEGRAWRRSDSQDGGCKFDEDEDANDKQSAQRKIKERQEEWKK